MPEMMRPDWESDLEAMVADHLPDFGGETTLDPATSLPSLGLDSLSTVRLLVAIEDRFQVEFPPEDLAPATFRTLESLRTVVARALDPSE